VAQLSRLVASAESRQVKQDLADGRIDIVIGTQRAARGLDPVQESRLIVIDEEHISRQQKERLKDFKARCIS